MKLDHLEWPASGDFQLYAIDQSEFYGNFCLVLFSPATARDVEKARTEHNTQAGQGQRAHRRRHAAAEGRRRRQREHRRSDHRQDAAKEVSK